MMSRNVFLLAVTISAAGVAVCQQTLLKNGGFEATHAVQGAASGDVGFGVWKLGGNNLAPDDWILNSAYPGELAVVSEGAHSGANFVRLRGANGQGAAHLYQPCPELRVGRWYRVSAWVRGGRVSVGFYEYFEQGPIGVPTLLAASPGPEKWRQVSSYYVPTGEGFKNASLALMVVKGERIDVDDVKVEELEPAAVPTGLAPIVLENDLVRMRLTPQASLDELTCKKTGTNYAQAGNRVPLFRAGRVESAVPARFLRRKGDLVEVEFADPEVKASIRIEARKRYFTFEVVEAQPADLEWLEMEFPLKRLKTQGWAFTANYDAEFATCSFALNFQTKCSLRPRGGDLVGLCSRCVVGHGIKGAKAALIGAPFAQFTSVIQDVERDGGLPCPVLDGKWVRESEPVRRSYLFATAMTEQDTDALIQYAKVGHFQTILILKDAFLRTHGHYEINTANFPEGRASFKRAVAKIRAAGLKAGVHVFGPSVSPNDPYVTPVPDERLLAVPCPALAEAVDEKATTLTLAGQPDLPPKRSRSEAFPGYHLRVGDEIIRYGNVEVGPPFRFTGCQRGACGTKAAGHPAGERVRGLLTMWGFFLIDPESTLLDEVTTRFADLVNDCGIDMIYFDASDGSRDDYLDVGYYLDKCHVSFYRKFDHGVLYQTSMGTGSNLCWHVVPRSASADGHGDIKRYLDERYDGILGMRDSFIYADVGWYGLDPGSRPDRLEYVCGKCLGCDGSISVQATRQILETHPFARQIMEMIGQYERCRLANYFPESVKAKLREKGKEFKLMPDGRGGWKLLRAVYEPERAISKLDGVQNVWTLQNGLNEPCRLALELSREVRYSSSSDYDNPQALVLEDFNDLTPYEMSETNRYEKYVVGDAKKLTKEGPVRSGVNQQFTSSTEGARAGKACGVLAATNSGPEGGWTGKGKRFPQPLDFRQYKALAFWVHGDGKGEILKLQLWDTPGHPHDFLVRVDFAGWQLHTFPIEERASIDWKRIEYLLFYYNSIPAKTTVSCRIDDVKALPVVTTPPALSGFELAVNGKRIRLPGEVRTGQTLTTDGFGTCTVWPGGMVPGKRVQVPETALLLRPGPNEVSFSCKVPEGSSPDVSLRFVRLWPLEK